MTIPILDSRVLTPGRAPGWYGAASAQVSQFMLQLQGLPASAWLAAADALSPERDHASDPSYVPLMEELADQAARRRLNTALDTMPVVVARVRARVDELVSAFADYVPEQSLHRMSRAARLTALALAAQSLLSREDVVRLCRPFRHLVSFDHAPSPHAFR